PCVRLFFFILCTSFVLPNFAFSQNAVRKVEGIVRNEAMETLGGVTIRLKGTNNTTTSNENGAFAIQVNSNNDVLVFSFVGMVTQEVTVGSEKSLNVILSAESQSLGEVVVVGYGTQKRANLTGSVSVMETDDLATRPFASTSSALQGVAPGVTVTSSS